MSTTELCNCDQALGLLQENEDLQQEITDLKDEIEQLTKPFQLENELEKAFMAGVDAVGNSRRAWLTYRLDIRHFFEE